MLTVLLAHNFSRLSQSTDHHPPVCSDEGVTDESSCQGKCLDCICQFYSDSCWCHTKTGYELTFNCLAADFSHVNLGDLSTFPPVCADEGVSDESTCGLKCPDCSCNFFNNNCNCLSKTEPHDIEYYCMATQINFDDITNNLPYNLNDMTSDERDALQNAFVNSFPQECNSAVANLFTPEAATCILQPAFMNSYNNLQQNNSSDDIVSHNILCYHLNNKKTKI